MKSYYHKTSDGREAYFYTARDGNIYDMFELIDMTANSNHKFDEFYKHLGKNIFEVLPLDVTNELMDKISLKFQGLF